MRPGRLRERHILDVAASERDVLIDVIFGRRRSVCGSPLRSKTFNWSRISRQVELWFEHVLLCLPAALQHSPFASTTAELTLSIVYKIPSYRFWALEIKPILHPTYGFAELMTEMREEGLKSFLRVLR